jgi:hypothetical protein
MMAFDVDYNFVPTRCGNQQREGDHDRIEKAFEHGGLTKTGHLAAEK